MLPKYPIITNPKIIQKNSFCQKSLFSQNLPKKPYCTNDLTKGLIIRNAETALNHRYIQHNQPNSKLWLSFDIDRATCPDEITDDLNLPAPTLFIQNPINGHAHALYALEIPVHLNEHSSNKAIRFAGAVDVSLSQALGADASYVGLITKNPLHESWRSYGIAGLYDLAELADYLDLSQYNDRRRHLPEIGLGRNCTLFDRTRKWAYKAIREHFDSSFDHWLQEVQTQALCYNTAFDSSLPVSEVFAVAKSIAKYVYIHFTKQGFSEIQAHRGKKGGIASGIARLEASADKRAQALEMRLNGCKLQQIADVLGVGKGTVSKWLKKFPEAISDSSP